jgi:hypothetical protein
MPNDAGLSLIEILVAITLLAGALIGTAGEVAAYVKQQVVEKAQVNANHIADSWFEYAESLEHASTEETTAAVATDISKITAPNPDPFTSVVNGVTYSELTTSYVCPAGVITLSACAANAGGTPGPTDTIYGQITVTWSIGGQTHHVTMTRNLADDSPYKPADTQNASANALLNCTRAGASPSGTLAFTPDSGPGPTAPQPVDLSSSNHPIASGNAIGVTLTTKGLANTVDPSQLGSLGPATCVPLLWTDANGTHQVDMHTTQTNCNINSGNYTTAPCVYTASIPTASITQPVSTPTWDANVAFCAYLTSGDACASSMTSGTSTTANGSVVTEKNFVVDGPPSLSSCTASFVNVLGITIGNEVDQSLSPTTLSGTGTNFSTGTTVKIGYTASSGPGSFVLPAPVFGQSGSNYTYTEVVAKNGITPAPKANLLKTQTFTCTVTRSDGKSASTTASVLVIG